MCLKRLRLLFLLGMGLSRLAAAQAIRVDPAQMPKGVVALEMRVGGRVRASAPGVVNTSGAEAVVYQWPGTYFQAAFRGDRLYLQTGKGRQGLHLIVDRLPAVAFVSSSASVYRVAGLPRGSHTVRLEVVTESQAGAVGFGGFLVPAKDRLSPPGRRSREIEFIGDSYTVGYGNTSGKNSCSREEVWSTTDDSAAFGPLLAKYFGADFQVNAISGRGAVRNYNGGSSSTLPQAYPFVLFDRQQPYVDPAWKPQVIVVGLGTNDFSTPLHPGEPWARREQLHTAYEAAYRSFLNGLRERAPDALLVVWATDGERGEIEAEAGAVAERLRADGDTRIAFLPVSGLQMSGCDGHPSAADDEEIYALMREVIEAHADVWRRHPGLGPLEATEP